MRVSRTACPTFASGSRWGLPSSQRFSNEAKIASGWRGHPSGLQDSLCTLHLSLFTLATDSFPLQRCPPWAQHSLRVGGQPLRGITSDPSPDRDLHPARNAKLRLAHQDLTPFAPLAPFACAERSFTAALGIGVPLPNTVPERVQAKAPCETSRNQPSNKNRMNGFINGHPLNERRSTGTRSRRTRGRAGGEPRRAQRVGAHLGSGAREIGTCAPSGRVVRLAWTPAR